MLFIGGNEPLAGNFAWCWGWGGGDGGWMSKFWASGRGLPPISPRRGNPANNPKNQNFVKMEKNAWRYRNCTLVYQKLWSNEVLFLRYGAWQTDGWMDGKSDLQRWVAHLKQKMKKLSFITQFKIEFLLLFIGCRRVLGKVPVVATKYHVQSFVPFWSVFTKLWSYKLVNAILFYDKEGRF